MAEYKSRFKGSQIDAGIDKANTAVQPAELEQKQDLLISGQNIKTINNQTLLGTGNINISGGGGSGADKFDYNVDVVALIDDKDDIIENLISAQADKSWEQVVNAIENGDIINVNMFVSTPNFYLDKSIAITPHYSSSDSRVEVGETGAYLTLNLYDIPENNSKADENYFEAVITTDENDVGTETWNRLSIYTSNYTDNYNIGCYYYNNGNRIDVNVHYSEGRYITDPIRVDYYENMPELHIECSADKYVEYDYFNIGYERATDDNDFSYDYSYPNDYRRGRDYGKYSVIPEIIKYSENDEDYSYALHGIFNQNLWEFEFSNDKVDIDNARVYEEIEELYEEVSDMKDKLDGNTVSIELNGGNVTSHFMENVIDILYYYDNKDGYELSYTPNNALLKIDSDGVKASAPCYVDISDCGTIPDRTYDYESIEEALQNVKVYSQINTTVYKLENKKNLLAVPNIDSSDIPYDYDYYDNLDTSNMLHVMARYNSSSGDWVFDRPFSEIFNDDVKSRGILLTIDEMYSYDNSKGYDYEYNNGNWELTPVSYTQALTFDENNGRFSGAHKYYRYHDEGKESMTVEWYSYFAIEVIRRPSYSTKDLATIPTVSIIKTFLTNINDYTLQTFTVSEVQYDSGYPYYIIYRNGNNLSYTDAADYMEYMTGSRYVPMYNYEKPLNSLFITPDLKIYKPQFNGENGGMRLYLQFNGLPNQR